MTAYFKVKHIPLSTMLNKQNPHYVFQLFTSLDAIVTWTDEVVSMLLSVSVLVHLYVVGILEEQVWFKNVKSTQFPKFTMSDICPYQTSMVMWKSSMLLMVMAEAVMNMLKINAYFYPKQITK
jgi:hypothetical protein